MSETAVGDNLLLGRGKVYLDRFDSGGNRTGERFIGNVDDFNVTFNPTKVTKRSSSEAAAGILKEVVTQLDVEFSMSCNEHTTENLALFMMGDEATFSQSSGGPVTDEAINGVQQGRYYQVGGASPKRSITTVVVTDDVPNPAFTLGTDYTVDAARGRIYIVVGGGIADGTNLLVDYSHDAISALKQVDIGKSTVIEAFLRWVGDPAEGPTDELEIWKVSITPDGALALHGEDFGAFVLKGLVIDDSANHPSTPHGRMIQLAA